MPTRPISFIGGGARSASTRTRCFWSLTSRSVPGPNYHVYLVPNAKVRDEAHVKGSMFIDLGRLRAFKGSRRSPSRPAS